MDSERRNKTYLATLADRHVQIDDWTGDRAGLEIIDHQFADFPWRLISQRAEENQSIAIRKVNGIMGFVSHDPK